MPIYEYACRKCGKTFEYMQRMSDPVKRKCEACGGLTLDRVISQTSFQLKGSGWYKDLYSSPKPGSGSSEGKSEGTSDAKSESKSEGKSDSGSGTSSGASSGGDAASGSGSSGSSASPSTGSGSEGTKPGKKTKKGSR
ncbi:MAG TPA: zinc ribbon domain-containing protein [Kofleriaceae bacterium]|nr:zinc ribbon domain-containing protein [Kofleriaceae bacterium]